ncbi:glycoside hydrolase N-terminal domain-containing protein [Acidicapsa dinghuensis]|uniref:Glycoside hydrolase N-terminal domain-containing protein n=1 Tax=Acidicapsa dinghuensis TaxID=2218256 RepID=A0ABW1EAP7_9BACT|nr:glycoside hydrolase N-terminal domain-containing protein [Acidicapsa dinghuensis]
MKSNRRDFMLGAMATAALNSSLAMPDIKKTPIWFEHPADRWLQALPVGNGRLGAMVFGGASRERLHLTESTLWSGAVAVDGVNSAALKSLPEIRNLFFAGRYTEAEELCRKNLLGNGSEFGTALPMAFLEIETILPTETSRYRRSLDLEEAIARVEFAAGDATFHREVFASHPDKLIVVRIESSKRGKLSCNIAFGESRLPGEITAEAGILALYGHAWESLHSDGKHGTRFECQIQVIPESGQMHSSKEGIAIQAADAVTLLIAIASDFRGGEPEEACSTSLSAARSRSYESLREAHIADHSALYRRVSIDLGQDENLSKLPTDQRRKRLEAGADDPGLCALFFQYGRYLTIAGSREDSPLPLALQGIWNDGLAAAMGWTDDFHLDINTQQNYWLCEVGNLGECHAPLAALVERLTVGGSQTAREMYGAEGWVAHVVTNAWGYSAPGWGLGWGMFMTGGVWIALQLWEHYRFTGDQAFLREKAYPVLRDAARFFLSYMIEHPTKKWLVTGPSNSPENWFIAPDTGKPCSDSMGPTCDRVLVYSLFSACIQASEALGLDETLRARIVTAQDSLPPLQIGKYGQLQEWLEDFEEAEPNHRHTSHLIALYPEDQISPDKTPALAAAARVTIERRIHQPNWEDTEWSRANLVNYYARLLDADAAHRQLCGLIAHAADDSLLTYSRGGVAGAESNIFAIDGNTAGAAGVAEMLLQSQGGLLHLLPALPSAWPTGSVRGLRARGCITVSIFWRGGRLSSAIVKADHETDVTVRYRSRTAKVHLRGGTEQSISIAMFREPEAG